MGLVLNCLHKIHGLGEARCYWIRVVDPPVAKGLKVKVEGWVSSGVVALGISSTLCTSGLAAAAGHSNSNLVAMVVASCDRAHGLESNGIQYC